MPKIISLEENEPRRWVAKYKGNYGTYNIRLTVAENGKALDFSCSCPSDYYPCKHIGMIMEAIPKYVARQEATSKTRKNDPLSTAKLLANIPEKELRAFVVSQAARNADLRKAVLLEFAPRGESLGESLGESGGEPGGEPDPAHNPYARIIHEGLAKIDLDDFDDDYYHDESFDLDVLDEMFDKADACIKKAQYSEAILIAKTCLEEYAQWADANDSDTAENYLSGDYGSYPITILRDVVEKGGCDSRGEAALYDYCKAKAHDDLFDFAGIRDNLHALMLVLAIRARNADFIAETDKLLAAAPGMSPYTARHILDRKMAFHTAVGEPDKAEAVLQANLNIDDFREIAVDKLIAEGKYAEAKALIARYPQEKDWRGSKWDKRLLTIARKERDTPKIREYAWRFIEGRFDGAYYRIYKSAFGTDEWPAEFERLVKHYNTKPRHFFTSLDRLETAELLAEEKLAERLLALIEKNSSPMFIERYHERFAASFPERTLTLFKAAVDAYAEKNVAPRAYEDVAKWLGMIRKIPGGTPVCDAMLAHYREAYKRRRAMMRILAEKLA